MATRKKKSDSIVLDMPGTIGGAKLVFPETKVVKGSHLTVTTHPDGKTTLEWDDEALMRDVREALSSVESTPKRKTKEKENGNKKVSSKKNQ
jgi:hypothetical protein